MKKLDRYERGILSAYEKGTLVPARPTRAQLGAFRAAARATFVKSRRVNIRLSAMDLMGIQARAYEEGVPYQTLIASVLPLTMSVPRRSYAICQQNWGKIPARKRAAR